MRSTKKMPALRGLASSFALALLTLNAVPVVAQSVPAGTTPPPVGAASAPVRSVAGAPTPSVSEYRINSGDQLEVYVWGEERLQREMTVLPDGTIAFPLVGQLRVAGQLPQDVERMVSERLRSQYRGEVPVVTVTVKQAAGMRFSIIGKVNAPGVFSTGRYINILEAIAQAGGPAEFANMDGVSIIRDENGVMRSIPMKLSPLFRAGVSDGELRRAGIVRILPGDVIIVP